MIIKSDKFVKNPLVSVIVLTYNQEKYICSTIESVLSQKCNFDYEFILSDDYSKDKTRKICMEYQKKYPEKINLFLQEKNQGIFQNYVDVLHLCNGKYIAQLGGDDYWTDELKLQKQVDILENNAEYGLVYTDTDYYYEETKTISKAVFRNKKINMSSSFEEHLVNKGFLAPSTWMFRKEYNFLSFNYTKKYVDESFAYLLDIFNTTRIFYLDESTAVYRVTERSASRITDLNKFFIFHNGLFEIQKEYIKKYNLSKEVEKRVKSEAYFSLLKIAIVVKNQDFIEEARAFFKENGMHFDSLYETSEDYKLVFSKTYTLGKVFSTPIVKLRRFFGRLGIKIYFVVSLFQCTFLILFNKNAFIP